MENETVTLSLEHYEEMQRELKRLREENQEKTIVKYEKHWVERTIVCGFFLAAILVVLIRIA